MIAAFRPQIIESDDDVEDESDQDMESVEGADQSSLVLEFEEKEQDHVIALNRVSCFAHMLQLVVQKFDRMTEFKSVLNRLVRKFNGFCTIIPSRSWAWPVTVT